jgi:uncharacterized membrane protein YciS (DUF1049 family)
MFNLSHILLSVSFSLGSIVGYILCGILSFNREEELIEVIQLKEIEIQQLKQKIQD